MSVLLDFNQSKDPNTGLDFGIRSGVVNMRQPKYLDPNKPKAYRVLRVILSPNLPNIYSYNGFSNTTVNISNNGGTTWTTVGLKTGIYDVQMLQDSINNVANQLNWYTNASDVGIIISYNPATQLIYTKLDSTKLAAAGQLAIDYSISSIYQMLGYTQTACTFLADGLYTATLSPAVDVQGTYVEIFVSFIQGTRWTNGQLSSAICRIPLQTNGEQEIIWPSSNTGMISPLVAASIPTVIQSYTVSIKTPSGQDAIFLFGNCIIEVEVVEQ